MTQGNQRRSRRQVQFRMALVVWKKTYLQEVQEQQDKRMLDLIAQRHPSVAKVVSSHDEHMATVETVKNTLRRKRIKFTAVQRDRMEAELASGKYDLVVTVGGDGTTLDASHYLGDDVPVLGVNSALSSSTGHYCVANVHNFADVLREVLSGARKPLSVMRLQLVLDGVRLPEPVVNEVLVAHADIGATSRYIVSMDGRSEAHKSDGFFVGTPSGSTGWMHSYGADVLPVNGKYMQYLTRGLITPPGIFHRFRHGLLSRNSRITVISEMPAGKLFVDGRHIQYDFPRGAELIISACEKDLRLYHDENCNQRYLTANPVRRDPPRH